MISRCIHRDNRYYSPVMIIPKFLKNIHISKNERWMFAIVAIATLARFLLIYFNWPTTNSDEGNMGLLAFHVAFQGDHPPFSMACPIWHL